MLTKTAPSANAAANVPATDRESQDRRDFFKIASVATALGFGCAAASTASLRSSPDGFSFQIGAGTFVAFVIGGAIGLLYWKLIAKGSTAARLGSVVVGLGGIGLFLYPLRFVPAGTLPDLAVGLVIAAGALGVVGFLIWEITRFLDSDARRGEALDSKSDSPAGRTSR